MSLKQIKGKIISAQKTGQVTKAMESVSAVKMRKSQNRAFLSRPYIQAAIKVLWQLSDSPDGIRHPFAKKHSHGKTLAVLVTSDKGLVGSVNSAVLKQCDLLPADTDFITLGRKATEYTARLDGETLASYTNLSDQVEVADVVSIADRIFEAYNSSHYKTVVIIYQNFISTFEQEPTKRTILPLDSDELKLMMREIKPRVGKFSHAVVPADDDGRAVYTVEPSAEEVLDILIPQLIRIMVYHAVIESKASEHSARMVAMKNATDKSKDMVRELQLAFNQARQAAITAEVSEITGGIEALK